MLTKIDVLEEGEVERSTNGEVLVFRENNVTTVVAALDSTQNVLGVVLAVTNRLDRAGPLAHRRRRERFARVVGCRGAVWSLRGSDPVVTLLDRRSKRCGRKCECKKLRDTHFGDCAVMSGSIELKEPVVLPSSCRLPLIYSSRTSFRVDALSHNLRTGDERGETLPTMSSSSWRGKWLVCGASPESLADCKRARHLAS